MQLRTGHLSAIALWLIGCGGGGGSNVTGTAVTPAPPPPVVQQTFAIRTAHAGSLGSICPRAIPALLGPVGACPVIDPKTIATVDGRPFDIARLGRGLLNGQIAIVWGTMAADTARQARAIEFEIQHVVVGDIEATDPARAQLSVLGQRIQVVETTWFDDGVAIDDLVRGRRVAVSGYFSSNEIVATAIHDDPGTGYVLRGILQSDGVGGFRIGALQLDLSRSSFAEFPNPDGTPSEGDVVLVFADAAPVHSLLTPQSILFVRDYVETGTEDLRFFAGLVSRRPSPTELEIEGRRVDCALFRCEDLVQAEVGRLVALTRSDDGDTANVVAIGGATYEITGRVSAIDVAGGSITVLGFPVQVIPATLVVDAQEQPDRLSDIGIGDTVTVAAGLVGTAVVAGKIGTFGTGQSIVSNYVDGGFTDTVIMRDSEIRILGRTFVTNASTPIFEDCTGARSPEWLLEVYHQTVINSIRIEVPDESPGPIAPVRIDVATEACHPWDY